MVVVVDAAADAVAAVVAVVVFFTIKQTASKKSLEQIIFRKSEVYLIM